MEDAMTTDERIARRRARREAAIAQQAAIEFDLRADEPPLPTDAEVEALAAELAPCVEEFREREAAKLREAC